MNNGPHEWKNGALDKQSVDKIIQREKGVTMYVALSNLALIIETRFRELPHQNSPVDELIEENPLVKCH